MIKNKIAIKHFLNGTRREGYWSPSVDIYRYGDGWLVKCELAGVKKRDIQLDVQGHFLSVAGRRRDLLIEEGHQTYSMEIAYNRFQRVIELPINLDRAVVRTAFHDGMLLIYLQ